MPGTSPPTRSFARFPRTGRPIVIMLSGLPGSGKSYVGRMLAGLLPARIVENDSVRRTLFDTRVYSPAENRQVYRASMDLIREAVHAGHDVVFDATNLTETARKAIYVLSEGIDAGLAVVQLITTETVVVDRLERRISQPNPGDNSEAGRDVYRQLRPIFSRSRMPHWRIEAPDQVQEVVDDLIRCVRSIRG